MPLLDVFRRTEPDVTSLRESAGAAAVASAQIELLEARLIELEEQLDGWQRMDWMHGAAELSRGALMSIVRQARLNYLKNPLVQRGVHVQRDYVFGQGVNVHARHPLVDEVVQEFWDDLDNKLELTSHTARMGKEVELQVAGNLFFVLFPNRSTGHVKVRTVPFEEIDDVIRDPEDRKKTWFYVRVWTVDEFDLETGQTKPRQMKAYYPDWHYKPIERPSSIGGAPVQWDTPMFQVKVGGFDSWKFGVSEVYASLDWARAHKEMLEDDATRSRALARFAWSLTTKGGKQAVAAAKSKLGTTFATGSGTQLETNPPPTVASTWIASESVDMKPMQVAGATMPTDHTRPFKLMVAAALGLPETFFGDADVGNHATASTLDRPTELKMEGRRELWAGVLHELLDYVVDQAAAAPSSSLPGTVTTGLGGQEITLGEDPETGEEIDRHVDIDFPALLEHSVTETIGAIVEAATLNGHPSIGVMPQKTLSRLLLVALGVDQVDEVLEELYPDEGAGGGSLPTGQPGVPPEPASAGSGSPEPPGLAEAVRELRGAIERLRAA